MTILTRMGAALLFLLACCAPVYAAKADEARVVPIANGLNTLNIDGNEVRVFRAWRENFNAHGFDVITFYLRDKAEGPNGVWGLVPLLSGSEPNEKERLELTTGGGADCSLHDFRLLIYRDGRRARLVVANRELGKSYADAATVRFDYYELARNDDGTPGRPPFYFKASKTVAAKSPYCDVNEAFDKELHLGMSSTQLDHGELHP